VSETVSGGFYYHILSLAQFKIIKIMSEHLQDTIVILSE